MLFSFSSLKYLPSSTRLENRGTHYLYIYILIIQIFTSMAKTTKRVSVELTIESILPLGSKTVLVQGNGVHFITAAKSGLNVGEKKTISGVELTNDPKYNHPGISTSRFFAEVNFKKTLTPEEIAAKEAEKLLSEETKKAIKEAQKLAVKTAKAEAKARVLAEAKVRAEAAVAEPEVEAPAPVVAKGKKSKVA